MIGRATLLLAVLAAPLPASAGDQPYAGLEAREIKALSAEEIAALEGGLGFSQALAAELNGYPGPRHVIDLAEELALTPEQKSAVEALFREMQAEARAAGQAVLAQEEALEMAFRSAEASEAGIVAIATEIGTLRGVLRGIHLKYHVRTKALLTAHQVALYDRARGYADGVAPDGHGSHGHHHGG